MMNKCTFLFCLILGLAFSLPTFAASNNHYQSEIRLVKKKKLQLCKEKKRKFLETLEGFLFQK